MGYDISGYNLNISRSFFKTNKPWIWWSMDPMMSLKQLKCKWRYLMVLLRWIMARMYQCTLINDFTQLKVNPVQYNEVFFPMRVHRIYCWRLCQRVHTISALETHLFLPSMLYPPPVLKYLLWFFLTSARGPKVAGQERPKTLERCFWMKYWISCKSFVTQSKTASYEL